MWQLDSKVWQLSAISFSDIQKNFPMFDYVIDPLYFFQGVQSKTDFVPLMSKYLESFHAPSILISIA